MQKRSGLVLISALMLAACGGGGGGTTTTSPSPSPSPAPVASAPSPAPAASVPAPAPVAVTWPATDNFRVVMRQSGVLSATAPFNVQRTLIHPSAPQVAFSMNDVVQAAAGPTVTLYQANYDSAQRLFTGERAFNFVDVAGSTLRALPLTAKGARPVTLTTTLTGSTSLASYCPEFTAARDFSDPYASQIVLVSRDSAGQCATAGVQRNTTLTFGANGQPSLKVDALGNRLGYFRSAATGKPTQWVAATTTGAVNLIDMTSGTVSNVVPAGTDAQTIVPH